MTEAYIFIPLIGYIFLSFIAPKIPQKYSQNIQRPWFEPSGSIFTVMWIPMYLILGYLYYQVDKHDVEDIKLNLIFLTLLTYLWGYTYRFNLKITVLLLILSMFITYTVYNAIFLSKLTEGQKVMELNLASAFLIWNTFIFTIVVSSGLGGPTENVSSIETL